MLRLSLTVLLLASTSLTGLARAEDAPAAEPVAAPAPAAVEAVQAEEIEPATVPHSRILPVKIKPVQKGADGVSKAAPDVEQQSDIDADTLALYTSQKQGSFGPALWKGLSRDEVIKGLRELPSPKGSPALRELTLRVLLSKSPVPPSSAEPSDSGVFGARLSKLAELGAYREAMTLYEKLDAPATTAEAALGGMKAFVGNGQIAVACLEQMAIDQALKSDDAFWQHLDQFCKTLLRIDETPTDTDVSQALNKAVKTYVSEQKITPPAQFEDLNNKSLIELLVLAKSGMLERGKWSVSSAAKLDPDVVSFLLSLGPAQIEQKLSLLTAAVDSGIRTPAELEAAYTEAAASPVPHGDWAPLLNAYAKIQKAQTEPDKLKHLKAMLAQIDLFSPASLTPLVPLLESLKPAIPLVSDDALASLRVLVNAGAQIPADWVGFAYDEPKAEEAKESGESMLLALWARPPAPAEKDKEDGDKPQKAAKPPLTPELAYSLILQAYLREEGDELSKENPIYDNFLSLTGSSNYVMPSSELTESLKRAAQSGSLGRTLLYSLKALNGQKVDQTHPQTLYQVLRALKTAGLSEETVSLAHEALEGLTKKKEN